MSGEPRKRRAGAKRSVHDAQVDAEGIHVWPFDREFPVDVVQHVLSGRQPFRMNRHDYVELVFLHSGELVWQVLDRSVTQKKGDLFVMASPKYHRVTQQSSRQAKVTSLFFHPDLLRTSMQNHEESEYLTPFLRQDSLFRHVLPPRTRLPAAVYRLMRRIKEEMPATSDRARLCVRTYVKMIMVLLLEHHALTKSSTGHDYRQRALARFSPLFEFLAENYQGAISPEDAAETVNMSPSHFRRAFKHITGQSFVPYLNQFRIAKAQELLSDTELPIAEIGMEVGFCDQSYFSLVFRRLTSMTPRQYRQQSRTGRAGTGAPISQHPPGVTLGAR